MLKNFYLASGLLIISLFCSDSYQVFAKNRHTEISKKYLNKPIATVIEYPGIMAKAEGKIITARDVENRLKLAFLSSRSHLTEKMKEAAKKDILKELIDETLKYKWAKKFKPKTGWVSKEEVEKAFADIAKRNNMDKKSFVKFLNSHAVSEKILKKQIMHQMTWMRYIEARYTRSIKVPDQEIDREYAEMLKREGQNTYCLSRLFIPFSDQKHEASALRRITNLQNMLMGGANIADLARQFSKSKEAANGGDLGWVVKEQLSKEEYSVVKNMDVGSLRIVKNRNGYSLLILRDKKRGGQKYYTLSKVVNVVFGYRPGAPLEEEAENAMNLALSLKDKNPTCSAFLKAARSVAQVSEANPIVQESLPKELENILKKVKVNSLSEPVMTPNGVIVFCVLARSKNNISLPSKDDLKMQKFNERLEIFADRELQDIKKRATWDVEKRLGTKSDYI